LSLGTYHSPNSPITSPAAQVHIHHLASAGRLPRMMSSTISATAQPIVTVPVTSWSFASSGGGGAWRGVGRGPRDSLTRPGYEVPSATDPEDAAYGRAGVMYLGHAS
jgi:hypothetical protein